MKIIPLTQDEFTLVDDEDYDYLIQFEWYVANGYAMSQKDGFRMHHEIAARMGLVLQPGYEIDHKNRDPLDNRRQNLRLVTRSVNNLNQGPRKDSTIGLRGISFYDKYQKYLVRVQIDGVRYSLGYYEDVEEAKRVRDTFLRKRGIIL